MDSIERREYARRVVSNPTRHYIIYPHPDVKPEWIERTIAEPYHQENDGRELYYGWINEMKNWLRVVVENGQLVTAYLDWRLTRRFGRLS